MTTKDKVARRKLSLLELAKELENVSRAYEADVETRVAALTSLLEPLMIVALGAIVAFITMAILMPLIQMNQLAQ